VRPLIFILAVAITIVVALTIVRRHRERSDFQVVYSSTRSETLPKLWTLPEFTLSERSGQPATLSGLKGKVWVADFFYTTCPGPCPMLTSRLSDLHKALSKDEAVRLVSISSDPEKDTPEVLRAYARQFGASERWLFLTGPKTDIYRLANEGFKLALAEDPTAKEPISHSTKLVLVDRTGTVRGFYDGLAEDQKRLLADVRRLAKE
jgi:protein SCO1/2